MITKDKVTEIFCIITRVRDKHYRYDNYRVASAGQIAIFLPIGFCLKGMAFYPKPTLFLRYAIASHRLL